MSVLSLRVNRARGEDTKVCALSLGPFGERRRDLAVLDSVAWGPPAPDA